MHLRRSWLLGLFLFAVSSVFVSHGDSLPQVAELFQTLARLARELVGVLGVVLAKEIARIPCGLFGLLGNQIS